MHSEALADQLFLKADSNRHTAKSTRGFTGGQAEQSHSRRSDRGLDLLAVFWPSSSNPPPSPSSSSIIETSQSAALGLASRAQQPKV